MAAPKKPEGAHHVRRNITLAPEIDRLVGAMMEARQETRSTVIRRGIIRQAGFDAALDPLGCACPICRALACLEGE